MDLSKVVGKIGSVAYKLELPSSFKIHDVFHVSKLKPYVPASSFHPDRKENPRPSPFLIGQSEEFEVEKLVDKWIFRGRTQYLVHWLGYEDSERTWVDVKDLGNAMDLVEQFEDTLPLDSRQRELRRGNM